MHQLPWKQSLAQDTAPKSMAVTIITDAGEIDLTRLMQWSYQEKELSIKPRFEDISNILGLIEVELGHVNAGQLKMIVRD